MQENGSGAPPRAQMTITILANGHVVVHQLSPQHLADKLLCFGMLEMAKVALLEHWSNPSPGGLIVPQVIPPKNLAN